MNLIHDRLINNVKLEPGTYIEVPSLEYLRFVDEIVDNSLDAVVAIDAMGIIRAWSREAEVTFGWARNEVLGRALVETIIPAAYREAHTNGIKKFYLTGEGPVLNRRVEVNALNKQGVEIPIELYVRPVRFGKEFRFYAFIKDLSKAKDRGLEFERLNSQLAMTLRERDEFLTVVSHELKTPLTSLRLQVQLVERHLRKLNVLGFSEEKLAQALTMCYKQVDSLNKIVSDLLDISMAQSGHLLFHFTEGNLALLIQETSERFAEEVKLSGCTLQLELDTHVFGLFDANRIEQVITNLISNAIKHARKSHITIRLLRLCEEDNRVRLSVSDSGPGIHPENLLRIFEPSFRSSQEHLPGLGLGLYISKKIVDGHSGKIWAENRIQGGAEFHVELALSSLKEMAIGSSLDV